MNEYLTVKRYTDFDLLVIVAVVSFIVGLLL